MDSALLERLALAPFRPDDPDAGPVGRVGPRTRRRPSARRSRAQAETCWLRLGSSVSRETRSATASAGTGSSRHVQSRRRPRVGPYWRKGSGPGLRRSRSSPTRRQCRKLSWASRPRRGSGCRTGSARGGASEGAGRASGHGVRDRRAGNGQDHADRALRRGSTQPIRRVVHAGAVHRAIRRWRTVLPMLEATERLARAMGDSRLIDVLRRHAPTWAAQLPSLLTPPSARRCRTSFAARRKRGCSGRWPPLSNGSRRSAPW